MSDQPRSARAGECLTCSRSTGPGVADYHAAINAIAPGLDERNRRRFAALLASQRGRGGVTSWRASPASAAPPPSAAGGGSGAASRPSAGPAALLPPPRLAGCSASLMSSAAGTPLSGAQFCAGSTT